MSRITGSDAKALMEAYASVYAPQEITEEQTWQEVENWVNSLVEEGYDLSEYTWEDMYEAYIEEQGRGRVTGSNPNVFRPAPTGTGSRRGAAPTPSSSSTGSVTSKPGTRTGSNPNVFKPTPSSQGSRRGAAPVPGGQGSRPLGSTTQRGGAPTPAARPAAPAPAARPAARPAAPASTAKTAPTPAAKPATPQPAATAKSANPMMSGLPKAAPSMAAPAGGVQLSARAQALKAGGPKGGARERMLNQSFDAFDAIKGHLLDEGYADTEEAAVAIMANMSEEWKQSILSEDPVQDYRDMRRSAENKRGDRGPELSHSVVSKGTPKPGSASIGKGPRSREFTNPPS